MSILEITYIIISLLAAIINMGIAIYMLQRRQKSGMVSFSVLMFLITFWIIAQLLSLLFVNEKWMLFWVNVRFFPLAFTPYIWFIFSLQFYTQNPYISRKLVVALAIIPTITQIMVWTNPYHHLFLIDYTSGFRGSFFLITSFHWGPFFWVHTTYSFAILFIGIMLIIHAAAKLLLLYRGHALLIITSIATPIIITIIQTFEILPIHLDLTPITFSITGLALFINIVKFRFTNSTPITKEKLIEFMRDGMILINQNHEILDINQAAILAFHSTLSGTLGKKLQDVFPFMAIPDIGEQEVYEIEPHIGKEIKRFEVVSSPIQRDDNFTGWFIIIRDITEIAMVEIAYRDIERRFNKVIMHSHESIVLVDDTGKIVVWNKAIENILNMSRSKMIGRYVWDIIPIFIASHQIPARNISVVTEGLRQSLITGKSPMFDIPIEIRLISTDQEEHFVEFIIYPIKTSNGYYICFSGHNITDQIRARLALQQANDTLEQLVKERTADLEDLMNSLEQRIQDRTSDLSILYQISATANQILNMEEMLNICLTLILDDLNADGGTIHIYNHEKNQLDLIAHVHMEHDFLTQIQNLPIEQNIFGRIIERGSSITSPDLSYEYSKSLVFPKTTTGESYTYSGNIMQTKGNKIGVLSIFQPSSKHFSVEQIALLTTISEQLGVVIENHTLQHNKEAIAVIEERQRLARDLHDSVTQRLYSLMLYASAGKKAYENHNENKVKHHLDQIDQNTQQALREMRLLIHELRPDILEKEGFIGAITHRLEFVEKRAGVDYELNIEGQLDLSRQEEVELFTILTEALNNSLKHANASKIIIQIVAVEEYFKLEICDNGIGFDENTASNRNGLGIISMRERAERIGGKFSIHSETNSLTCVCIEIGSKPVTLPHGKKKGVQS
jgi:PAS domain S-box-containing protein